MKTLEQIANDCFHSPFREESARVLKNKLEFPDGSLLCTMIGDLYKRIQALEQDNEALVDRVNILEGSAPTDKKKASELWLRNIASQCGVGYERMMDSVASDDYIYMGSNEHYKDVLNDRLSEFKMHCEIVLGRALPDIPYPFSCSC